jgi:flagellar hook-length control protein FliK
VSQPDILAIFAPQAPVEQGVTPQKKDVAEDDGFQRIMDNESNKVSPTKENNKPETDRQDHSSRQDTSSPQKASDKKQIEKPKKSEDKQTDKTTSNKIDENTSQDSLNKTQSSSIDSEKISPEELASVENLQEAMDQLKELGFNVQAVETLLEIFQNDSGIDIGSLLQSLTTQNQNLKDFSLEDFLSANKINEDSFSLLENRKGLISELLKKSGLNDQEAKNLVPKFESAKINTSNVNGELTKQDFGTSDKAIKPEAVNQASKSLVNIETTNQNNKGNEKLDQSLNLNADDKTENKEKIVKKSDIKNRLSPDANKELGDADSTSDEKVSSKENIKTASKNIAEQKTVSQNTIGMKYADGTLDAAKNKNLEANKINGEIQTQNNNLVGGGNNKSESTIKAVIQENAIYKAPIEKRVIDQIINRLSVRSNGSQSEVKIRLDPPSLGSVRMSITSSADGVRTLIVAENQAVKQLIESNLSQLRDSMLAQGLTLDGFSVLVGGDSDSQFSQQQNNFRQSNNEDEDFDFVDIEELEAELNNESTRQTSFMFNDGSQTFSIVA